MNYQQLLEQVYEYVSNYYQLHNNENLLYHNKQHTEDVAGRTTEIANHYQLNDHDFFIVSTAAWFHDLGYMIDPENHEEQSALLAETFLKSLAVNEMDITAVKKCIMATRMPQSPSNLMEEIICDADLYNLGTDNFFKKDKLLLQEINTLHHKDIGKLEWHQKSIKFLEDHHYHTDYCQLLLSGTQEKNVEALKDKVAKAENKSGKPEEALQETELQTALKPAKTKKSKDDRPEKGIETMFRISSGNHQRLSDMADKKAHIMITVNSIILSALISLVLRRLNEYEYLLIPTVILLSVSLMAMTFSILSTRPSIPNGIFSKADVDEKRVNLLFFGNFYKMTLADYTYGMVKMMEDKDFLYGSLIKDVYAQGVVLGKKYRLLRVAYNIFMFGLILSVLAFIVAVAFFNTKRTV